MEKRSIDILRKTYGRNKDEISTEFSHTEEPRKSAVVVAGVAMSLHLVNGRGGSLMAVRCVRDVR